MGENGVRHRFLSRWPPETCPAARAAGIGLGRWTSSTVDSAASRSRSPNRPGTSTRTSCPGDDGWTVVDTGLGLPDARERWTAELSALDGEPVRRIVVTHFHPDHVGAAADLAELTGASVSQGRARLRAMRARLGRGGLGRRPRRVVRPPRGPARRDRRADRAGLAYRPFVRYRPDPELLDPGDLVAGWQAVAAPGHADGQLMLLRDGVLVAADHLLDRISPTVGLWPASRPDPLGDYLEALRRRSPRADARVPRPRRPDRPTRSAGRGSSSTIMRAPRRHGCRSGRRAVERVRGLVSPLRRRPEALRAAVRRRRDALPPRAPRPRGRRATPRDRRSRYLYFRGVVDGELPPSTRAPEGGAQGTILRSSR